MREMIDEICASLKINATLGYGLVWGMLIAGCISLVFWAIIFSLSRDFGFWGRLVISLLPLIPFVGISWNFYKMGTKEAAVPIQHRGVVTRENRRREDILLNEGKNWVWPIWPIKESVIIVDVRERIVSIGTDESPFIVMAMSPKAAAKKASQAPISNQSEDQGHEGDVVRMKISVTLRWRIKDDIEHILKFLNTKGEAEVLNQVVKVANSALRDIAATYLDTDLMQSKEEFGKKAHTAITAKDSAYRAELEKLGVATEKDDISIIVGKVLPSSNEVLDAMEQQRVEELQQKGDNVEISNVISNVKRLHTELGGNITMKDAVDIFQAERGKATRWVVDGNAPPEVRGQVAGGAAWSSGGKEMKPRE
ncbi:SPFH domain-containing protein [Candidatus Nomurabacteria bacterium]|nr:SPFH domain-containing protein [Candidatus Nomurabacteria bacterium]